jgi:GNAT superfamily N-acetyltransferase
VAQDRYIIEPLGPQHDRAAFSSGEPSLDRFFREQARQQMDRWSTVVHVLMDRDAAYVVGFYTLSMHSVALTDLPVDMSRRLPRYPDVPAALLGCLAVDSRYQGRGFGRVLLIDALQRAYRASAEVRAFAVVVDALHDAARDFYVKYGFIALSSAPYRLVLPMAMIARLLPASPA